MLGRRPGPAACWWGCSVASHPRRESTEAAEVSVEQAPLQGRIFTKVLAGRTDYLRPQAAIPDRHARVGRLCELPRRRRDARLASDRLSTASDPRICVVARQASFPSPFSIKSGARQTSPDARVATTKRCVDRGDPSISPTMNGHANGHASPRATDFDIIVIGAGISGINAAYRIQTTLPSSSYTVLEGRHELGGTWSLFKYPGIRSDSDLHTFGFPFNPWTKPNPIATGESIVEYMRATAEKFGIDKNIRYGRKVERADWSSDEQRWRLEVNEGDGGTCAYYAKFLIAGTGYYNYDTPLPADIPGLESFKGARVHPQFWPEELDYKGKKMVVIGSGATAITILPAVVETGVGHVTMLQRSPSYVMNMPQRKASDPKPWYERWLPHWMALRITRMRFLVIPYVFYLFCRKFPVKASNLLRSEAKRQLPKDFPMDPHFKPTYNPWDQRLCLCPDSDFFKAFESGRAQIVTATIKRVVEDGIELDSGEKLEADIIVTATGLNLQVCGGVAVSVDKQPVNVPDCYIWRACMLSGVPNMAIIIGYVNASWTLGADSASRLLTRLIKYMAANNYTSATPRITPKEMENPQCPFALSSTYVTRAEKMLPHAGSTGVWKPRDNYFKDNWAANWGDLREGMEFASVST